MKKLLNSIVALIVVSVLLCMPVLATSDVVSVKDYTGQSIDYNQLYEMALQGELVNNEQIRVTIDKSTLPEGDVLTVVNINKLEVSKVLRNAEINNTYSARAIATLSKAGSDEYYAIKVTTTATIDEKVFGDSNAGVKITNVSHKWEQLDTKFKVTNLTTDVGQSGGGYTSTGGSVWNSHNTTLDTPNPTKGLAYPKSTGFTNYVDDIKGTALADTTATYNRGTGYDYELVVTLPIV